MLPFIEHGFERGDRAFHVVDPKRREEHQRRLEAAGIDVVAAQQSGQFKEAVERSAPVLMLSIFARRPGVRLRTVASKKFKCQINATRLIWKTLMVAEMSFRKLNAPQLVEKWP